MARLYWLVCLCLAATLAWAASSRAESGSPAESPPLVYEVMINGESFLVEANRAVKLQSKEKPGTSYDVAVRVAPTQRIKLNAIQFDYDLPARVEDDGKRENRSARLTHELGYTILITDLGQPLDAKAQVEALKILVDSVKETVREMKETKLDVGEAHQRTFEGSSARGVTIRYRDAKDIGHVCLVYLLTGPKFAATCVVQYVDDDSEDVLPLIKKVLDSVRAVRIRG